MLNKYLTKERIVALSMIIIGIIVAIILAIVYRDSLTDSLSSNFSHADNYKRVFEGLGNTIFITFLGFLIGIVMGLIICLVQGIKSDNCFILGLKQIAKFYVALFRGTPMIVQLLIMYFIIFASYRGDAIYIAIIAFGLNSGAYVSEIIRGGINSVPTGQMEAGRSLGLPYSSVMARIIFPQAIRNSLPSLGNEFITLIKETSIVGFVGAFDLTLSFRKIANATYDFKTVYLIMGITYFFIVLLFAELFKLLEYFLLKGRNTNDTSLVENSKEVEGDVNA